VLGHELSHVYNRDILISSVAAALAGILTFLANLAWFLPLGSSADDDAPNPLTALLMLVLGPLAAGLIQLAISRNREYTADADGAYLSADPLALASALDKIDRVARRLPLPADGTHASISHLMITNPLSGHGLSTLFRTHPRPPTASAAWSRWSVTPPADRRKSRVHPPAGGLPPLGDSTGISTITAGPSCAR
jgi:heat shock protein HtpX